MIVSGLHLGTVEESLTCIVAFRFTHLAFTTWYVNFITVTSSLIRQGSVNRHNQYQVYGYFLRYLVRC
jgi:hypothetical protein